MTAPLWTKDPVGTPVGMWCACRFFLSSTQRNTGRSTWISATRGGRTAVSDATLLRRRRLQGPARHHRAQPAHPPRRHDAPATRHTGHSTRSGTSQHSFGHEDEGADIQQHISAATGDPDGLHRPDMRSAVLVTYPPSHGIRAFPHLLHLWLCLAPRRCYSEGLPLTCGTGGI